MQGVNGGLGVDCFTERVTSIWNKLPEKAVDIKTRNKFQTHLLLYEGRELRHVGKKKQESVVEIKQTGRHVGPEVGHSPDRKIPSSGRLLGYCCSGPREYLSFTVAL